MISSSYKHYPLQSKQTSMNAHPYILKLQTEIYRLANWKYFQTVLFLSTIIIFFIIGRKTYESKFSHVLNTINDAENQKRRLKQKHELALKSLQSLRAQLLYFKIISLLVVLLSACYSYINPRHLQLQYLIWPTAALFAGWAIVLIRKKYLQALVPKVWEKLQKKTMSTQSDIKEIMRLLGEGVCESLKTKFEREIKTQRQQQQLRECNLKKCYDEKHLLKELYKLYKLIIQEMQEMKWCEVCAQNLNIEANELKLPEIQNRLKTFRSIGGVGSLQKRKELTNRLLEEWKNLQYKLGLICRRGCCILFRVSLDEVKRRHNEQLKSLKIRLSLLK